MTSAQVRFLFGLLRQLVNLATWNVWWEYANPQITLKIPKLFVCLCSFSSNQQTFSTPHYSLQNTAHWQNLPCFRSQDITWKTLLKWAKCVKKNGKHEEAIYTKICMRFSLAFTQSQHFHWNSTFPKMLLRVDFFPDTTAVISSQCLATWAAMRCRQPLTTTSIEKQTCYCYPVLFFIYVHLGRQTGHWGRKPKWQKCYWTFSGTPLSQT